MTAEQFLEGWMDQEAAKPGWDEGGPWYNAHLIAFAEAYAAHIASHSPESKPVPPVANLIKAVKVLLSWVPICSETASGYAYRRDVENALKNFREDGSLNQAVGVEADLKHPRKDTGGEIAGSKPAGQQDGTKPPRKIDGKFSTDGERIFNTVSGETVPDDEPLFLLRGRDENAVALLTSYLNICVKRGCNELHQAGIEQVFDKFLRFKNDHPERMKQPGITRHLKLEPVADVPASVPPQEKEK
jgi:hypothetical protein